MTREYKGWEMVALTIIGIAGVPYGWWANGYVLEHIWNWYLPPFAPVMTFKVALGVSFCGWMLISRVNKRKSEPEKEHDAWTMMILLTLGPWVALAGARAALWMFFE